MYVLVEYSGKYERSGRVRGKYVRSGRVRGEVLTFW